MFAWRLDAAKRISVDDVERYGVTTEQLDAIKIRFTEWAEQLRNPPASDSPERVVAAKLQEIAERMSADSSLPATSATSENTHPERRPTQGHDQGIER